MVMVASIDGKTTSWHAPSVPEWTSKEDKLHFRNVILKNKLIIMGRKTYADSNSQFQNSPGKLRIIMTSRPEKFKNISVPGMLEFTSENPDALIQRLSEKGYKEAVLAGGAEINSLFLASNLINEIWLTVEPVILGKGNGLISPLEITKHFKLKSAKKLNKNGTMLFKYVAL